MSRRKLWGASLIVASAGLLAAVGCGDTPIEEKASSAPPAQQATAANQQAAVTPPTSTPTTPSAAPTVKATAGTASIIGRVSFNGDPPKRRPISCASEKKCCDTHKTPPLDDSLVVGADRSVQWVLVRVAGKVPGNFAPPSKPAVFDQKGCVFSPHVLPVMVGQEVEIRNSDEVLHNVRCEATLNQAFNRNLPKVGDKMSIKFDAAEVGLKMKCDVHFWMGGVIHVLPHPFFAVTGEDGRFAIEKLPPGTHKLEVWHEKLGKQTKEITVKDGEVLTVDFEYQPK